jgi:hypothetical protein
MPCERAILRCSECGRYVTEEEWAKRGAPAADIESSGGGLGGLLASLLLAGERLQFCSPECKRSHQRE